ncbi:hypothetical protein OGAPHI_007085 [Ogataea philodendri]|uniref:SP-RING-type domain-containing protein n=1 Tax=Ogataea philodendri TaxID=1378263 RepID=A0A9P8SZV4_9ASCO|nr:uncharacterized protein OGAPHI_007085 [Ogataea philodendri]KAH3660499.1 hypothetical protein OGAPHI_007085 [Ogataea philodendri]
MSVKREREDEIDTVEQPGPSNPNLFQLPTYYPLNKKFKSELRQLHPTKTMETLIKETDNTLMETLFKYIDANLEQEVEKLVENKLDLEEYESTKRKKYKEDTVLEQGKRVLIKLGQTRRRQTAYLTAFRKARTEILERNESELQLDDFEHYAQMTTVPSQIHDLYKETLSANSKEFKSAGDRMAKADELELNKKLFVSINPTEPIPFNDQEDDDEIEIGGGKVNLTCPISRLIMKNPIRNNVCGHTYDKASLANYRSTECPECGRTFSKTDLVEDTLMKIRLAGYKRDEKLQELQKSAADDDIDKL